MTAASVVVVTLAGCRKHTATGDPTADWFADHRKDLDTVRVLLEKVPTKTEPG